MVLSYPTHGTLLRLSTLGEGQRNDLKLINNAAMKIECVAQTSTEI
jgi:hypothetical protein